LQEVIDKLELKNIEVIHARAEEYAVNNREKFDVVTARAVAHLSILLEYSMPLVKKDKYFIAMKANIKEEIEESKNALNLLSSIIIDKSIFLLPYEESTRSLIKIKKEKITNKNYPRKYSEICKNKL